MPFASKNKTLTPSFWERQMPAPMIAVDSLLKREVFAVSLRKIKKKEILTEKRKKINRWAANSKISIDNLLL